MRTALNALRGRARLVAPVLAGPRPSLLLDMMQGVLDPRVQFSRASNATRIGPDGRLDWAPHNLIPNSMAAGGAPGVPPSGGWFNTGAAGVTTTIVGAGPGYIDIKFEGTASAVSYPTLRTVAVGTVSATQGQTMTGSCSIQLLEGDAAATAADGRPFIQVESFTAASVSQGGNSKLLTAAEVASGGRFSVSRTMPASSASVILRFSMEVYAGKYVNATFRVSMPQLELGSVAREFVPTSGAAYFGPRFDHDPVTRAPLGLLVEEQRTNELVVSENFSTASWAKTNCTVAAGGATSVMSGGAVFKVIEDTTNAAHQTNAVTGTPASSTAYTASVYARAAERGFAHLQVNTAGATSPVASLVFSLSSAGVVTEFDTGLTVRNVANTDAGGGWRRLSFTVTTPASCTMVALYTGPALNSNTRSYAGTAGSGVFVGQPQLEQGQSVSSYIPTYGTAATRASDVATLAVAGWLSPQRGTFVAQVRTPAVVNPGGNIPNTLMDLGIDGANRMQLRHEIAGTRPLVINAGASVFDSFVPNPAASSVVRFGFAYRPGSGDVSGQGAAANDSAVTYFNLAAATLHIGRGNWGGEIYNGHIQRLTYYPTDLTTAQLNRLTT